MARPLTSVSPSSLPPSLSSAREGVKESAGARDRELRGAGDEGRKGRRARAHARACAGARVGEWRCARWENGRWKRRVGAGTARAGPMLEAVSATGFRCWSPPLVSSLL
jgi:hypothetical protein